LAERLNALRPDSVRLVQADLGDRLQIEPLARETQAQFGGLDILVNNASSYYPTPIGSATHAQWDDLVGSNARSPFFLSQALVPALQQRNGCIVNLVDIHADRPNANHAIYSMAKAANAMMVKALARDLAPAIRVNGVAPGAALWPADYQDDAQHQEILKRIPMGRPAGVEPIVAAVMFMIAGTDYVTGQILAVDGGRSVQQ
jgi:pteridine reductase